jgi:hypothetical protein
MPLRFREPNTGKLVGILIRDTLRVRGLELGYPPIILYLPGSPKDARTLPIVSENLILVRTSRRELDHLDLKRITTQHKAQHTSVILDHKVASLVFGNRLHR